MRRRRTREEKQAIGCVVQFILIVFLMPVAGIFFLYKPDPCAKIAGAILLALGILLWGLLL